MRFAPGKDVTFFLEDGTELTARPFYFQRLPIRELSVVFLTDDARRIRCIDAFGLAFVIEETGQRCSLEAPIHNQ